MSSFVFATSEAVLKIKQTLFLSSFCFNMSKKRTSGDSQTNTYSIGKYFKRPSTVSSHDRNNEANVVESMDQSESQPSLTQVRNVTEKITPKELKFQDKWKSLHSWLKHDEKENVMWCSLCRDCSFSNAMAVGTNNFKTTTIQRHLESADHKRAIFAPLGRQQLDAAVSSVDTKEEKGIVNCLKVVYWMAKESVPLSKYTSLMNLLKELNTPNLDSLNVCNSTYCSYNTACDLLESISSTIDKDVTKQMKASPVLTIMTDESTDIAVHHKLCVTARIVQPLTMKPSTLFLTDMRIESATGRGIFEEIKKHLQGRNIAIKDVTGLGTDGATVTTGRKEGLTGQFLKENPHIINTHCSAHRIALCSEQAAEDIPAMKYYQGILESIFYYFKKSPKRNDDVATVQKLLDDPVLKYREVHQVRWLSFYQALDAVYRTFDSLISFFSTQTDPKAIGIKKKIGQDFFILQTYAMMDILQPIMRLNLFFQKKDVDIGLVQSSVDACLADLIRLRDGTVDKDKPTFTKQAEVDLVDGVFKSHHKVVQSKYSYMSTRQRFIHALVDNITKRFPDKQIMTSFCVLGLRPVTLLTDEDLASWGNESLAVLLDHFGKEKTHTYKVDRVDQVTTSPAIIDAEKAQDEWMKLKQVVKTQGYPRHSISDLWGLIKEYHGEDFPNLLMLASFALAHPVHTSDCERAFSAQNSVTTPLRNRLSGEHCDQLMRVMIGGAALSEFNFKSALKEWRTTKARVIFRK
ncbi:transmembrane protein C17orf113-like [Pecten maximus]|uniref:transmembrane protein C17orf113-like n=1 Tax=Pecten maximus TaxID=6579 RepID=UPI0014585D84|nr:transmembrane protein C17orf113-like [Pecten maximus]